MLPNCRLIRCDLYIIACVFRFVNTFFEIFSKIFLKKVLTNKNDCDIIDESQGKRYKFGSIAQLGEHLPYKQRVIGSSPIVSTI